MEIRNNDHAMATKHGFKMASKGKSKGKQGANLLNASSNRQDQKSGKGVKIKGDEERESLAYKVLSVEKTKTLFELETVQDVQEKMVEFLEVPNYAEDLKEAAILDYYTSAVWWAKEQSLTQDQLSAFYTVVHTLMENVKEKHLSLTENLKEFKKLLAGIGQENIDISGGLECFDVSQAKLIIDYMQMSLFQHYKLYEFMFSLTQAEEIIGTDLEIEVAKAADMPWPPPLDEGISDEIFHVYVASQEATPTPLPEDQSPEATAEEGATEETEGEETTGHGDMSREEDLLSQLTPEEVKDILDSVCNEMLAGLQNEIASKLREKENAFINRINKIHKVAEKS